MRHILKRKTVLLVVVLLSTLYILLVVLPKSMFSPKTKSKTSSKKYDLLINSYMNSGSRYTAQMFGFRQNAIYIYEPLWKFNVWGYFHANNLVCSSKEGFLNCSTLDNVNKLKTASLVNNVTKNSSVVEMMIDILDDMLKCDLSRLENVYVTDLRRQPKHADQDLNDYRSCKNSKRHSKMFCLKVEEKRCKKADHIVIKVLRLTTGSYDKLLERRKKLKILQLFRNPFAIINSRMETKHYPVIDYNSNAAALCSKMIIDYDGSVKLAKKYPGRVKMVFYEDIKSNVTKKINKLYEYIGMERDDKVSEFNKIRTNAFKSKEHSTMSLTRVSDNAHWWRSHMSFLQYQGVREMCKPVMSVFNLTNFKNKQELIEFNIPEMNLTSAFRI